MRYISLNNSLESINQKRQNPKKGLEEDLDFFQKEPTIRKKANTNHKKDQK